MRLADDFVTHLDYWAEHDRRVFARLLRIIEETLADPFHGLGKPEPMKHDYRGCWSRRLTKADRVVYRVSPGYVDFLSGRNHYSGSL